MARHLLQAGDAVIVDDPCWFWLSSCLQQQGLRVFGVPHDGHGPDMEQLRHLLQSQQAKLYVTNSVFHNPTSYNIQPARAYQVLNLLHEFDAYLLEDDIYGSFDTHPPALRYAALDQMQRVFYTSSASKIIGGSWRVGLLCCPSAHIEGLLRQKLPAIGLAYPPHTQNGLFVWLDTGVDTAAMALAAFEDNWLVAPGQLFSPQAAPSTHIRLNVARCSDVFLAWLADYRHQQGVTATS